MSEHGPDFGECDRCGSTEREEMLANGMCLACNELEDPKGETVEVSVEVLKKLTTQAQSRHPTVAHEEAVDFAGVLENELGVDL